MEVVVYERRKEGMRIEGYEYQYNLTLTTWLRADKKYGRNYQIYPEWVLAGIFDDVVLKYKDKNGVHYRFVQAKHVLNESQTLTFEQLFNKNQFKIEKYFESYEKFHKNFKDGKIEDLILFTNLALDENVNPFVEELPTDDDPIFQFKQTKTNKKTPIMHKLNSKFIDAYKDKLRCIVKSFINCCVNTGKGRMDDLLKDNQEIISTDIAIVEKGKFHPNFIDCEGLSEGTEQFRRIFLEESATGDISCLSPEAERKYLENVKLKFPQDFGKSARNRKTKEWPIWTPERETLFREFCGLFKLATSQPNERELIEYIESEHKITGRKPHVRLTTLHLKKEICNWYKNNNANHDQLNSDFLTKTMNSIAKDKMGLKLIGETEKNIDEMSPLQIEFKNIPFEEDLKSFFQQSEKNLFHLNTKGFMNVSLLKLFRCLEKLQQIDYLFCPNAAISYKLFEVFRFSEVFKIFVCEIQSDEIRLKFIKKSEEVLNENREKKVILVTNFNNGEEEMNYHHPDCEDLTHFEDLTEETQMELSEREISFQGADIAFNSIYGKEIPPNHQDIESWGILIDKQIAMNTTFVEFDLKYYINRTLTADTPYFNKDTIQRKLGDQHILTYNRVDFNNQIKHLPTKHVHLLYELDGFWCVARSNGKIEELMKSKEGTRQFKLNDYDGAILHQLEGVFVISDMAGYGKTTTTSYLANELQKQHPNGWVTRLQPSNLSFDPDEIELTPGADVGKYDAFLMEKLFNLSSPLERFIFKQYLKDEESESQLFFIFDGFDEISLKYQRVIIQAMKYLRTKRNVKFIGIGTRPQHQEQLENVLQSVKFKLLPFNHENKITFLEKFWLSRGARGQNKRLRDFSERLIRLISKSISDEESALTGIPLQMRMIGEIYKENAIKYLGGNLEENEIMAVDLFGLYDQFIGKKEDLYFDDKVGAKPGAALIDIFLKNPRKTQTEFAIKVIWGGDYRDMEEQLKDTIPLGIIQEHQGKYSFIHRTFAEFLFAKYILDYTQSVSKRVYIDHLMQVMKDRGYGVVRKFINSKLDYKKMASELERPEYREAIQNINHEQFQEAMITTAKEGTFQLFCFQLEFYSYWYPEEMKEILIRDEDDRDNRGQFGLLYQLFYIDNISLCILYMAKVWLTSDHNASELLLEMFKYLIQQLFKHSSNSKFTAKIVTELQDELEEKQILSEEYLKSILLGIQYVLWSNEFVERAFEYLKHLMVKHEQLFYSLLREKKKIVQGMVAWNENDEFYELFGETSDPNFVYSALVVPVIFNFDSKLYYAINLRTYLKFISKYIRHFDGEQLEEFKTELFSYIYFKGWYNSVEFVSQGRSLLEFLRNHPHIISLEEFMQKIKIHKNLSFIENCALWGWEEDLEYILDAGDIEVEKKKRLQLERCESLGEKVKCILKSIRVHNTDEQLMEIARVNCEFEVFQDLTLDVTILSKAISIEDELRIEIYSTWITSDELFDAFMTDTPVTNESIEFVITRFPKYKMRFFEINKNGFVGAPIHDELDFPSILENDNILNKEEFLRLNQLQNDDGETILFNICNRWNREQKLNIYDIRDSLFVWLQLMKRECTTDDIVRLFRAQNVEGKTVFQILNNKSIYSGDQQIQIKSFIYLFLKRMKLVEMMKEIDISKKKVKDKRRWYDRVF